MDRVSSIIISGEDVLLDDKHFSNCTFIDCQLIYSGGPVIFERTYFFKCHYLFHGAAKATVLYLQEVGFLEKEPGKWFKLAETVN